MQALKSVWKTGFYDSHNVAPEGLSTSSTDNFPEAARL